LNNYSFYTNILMKSVICFNIKKYKIFVIGNTKYYLLYNETLIQYVVYCLNTDFLFFSQQSFDTIVV